MLLILTLLIDCLVGWFLVVVINNFVGCTAGDNEITTFYIQTRREVS